MAGKGNTLQLLEELKVPAVVNIKIETYVMVSAIYFSLNPVSYNFQFQGIVNEI